MWLVQFTYDAWCQGYEEATVTVLVRGASSFEDACLQISARYKNAKYFRNMTI